MTETMSYAFLYGTDMAPETIRRDPALAGARFIGIGSVAATDAPELPALDGRVHGIVLRLAGGEGGDVTIEPRIGEPVRGTVHTQEAHVANRDEIIALARYWELPVAWWQFLSES